MMVKSTKEFPEDDVAMSYLITSKDMFHESEEMIWILEYDKSGAFKNISCLRQDKAMKFF